MIVTRHAVVDDAEKLLELMRDFAAFDGRPERVQIGADRLRSLLNLTSPPARFLIAEVGSAAVGFASYVGTYSTAQGLPGLCLEDLFVRESHRRCGVSKALMRAVAQAAIEQGCSKIEWQVGTHNIAALAAYAACGAVVRSNVSLCRLDETGIKLLAKALV